MFRRVSIEDWQRVLSLIGFALTFGVFFGAMIRALFIKKPEANRLSGLPLDDGDTPRTKDSTTPND